MGEINWKFQALRKSHHKLKHINIDVKAMKDHIASPVSTLAENLLDLTEIQDQWKGVARILVAAHTFPVLTHLPSQTNSPLVSNPHDKY